MQAEQRLTLDALSIDSAEPIARERLEEAQRTLGMVPNMYARMANSPGLLETYSRGYELFREHSGFSPVEQEVVLLAISRENGCAYCMAAHSFIADQMSKVPPEVTDAIRAGEPIPDPKLAALHHFTQSMVVKRGLPTPADVQAFISAGYDERRMLEIVLAIAVKTLSNYSNHLFHTPVDEAFAERRWNDPRCEG